MYVVAFMLLARRRRAADNECRASSAIVALNLPGTLARFNETMTPAMLPMAYAMLKVLTAADRPEPDVLPTIDRWLERIGIADERDIPLADLREALERFNEFISMSKDLQKLSAMDVKAAGRFLMKRLVE